MSGRTNHNAPQHLKRGAPLPYKPVAGVEPCPGGWFVVSGKLQGVSLFPEPPQVMSSILDVLDTRPSYEIIALHAPIGLPGERIPGGRGSDRQARPLLGRRRGAAGTAPPSPAHPFDSSAVCP